MEFHGLMDILIRFSDFKGEIDKVTDRNNHERVVQRVTTDHSGGDPQVGLPSLGLIC